MKEYQFYALDWKSIRPWLLSMYFIGGFIIIPIVMGIIYDNYNVCIFGLIVLAASIIPVINIWFATITVNSGGIEYRSYLKRARISWENIKSLGVYRRSRLFKNAITIIHPNEYDLLDNLVQKYIYVSTDDEDAPFIGPKSGLTARRRISNEYICFQWRREIFEEMNNYWTARRK